MDHAVSLVQAYLQLNGYFTVAEYPVIEVAAGHGYEVITDLDIMAFRFPGAGRLVPGRREQPMFEPDPVLGIMGDEPDMLIGEIKEGRATLNQHTRDPNVLRTVLARFGCCSYESSSDVVNRPLRKGSALTHGGHRVRLMAFGSRVPPTLPSGYQVISLGHMVAFIEDYLKLHWSMLHHAQFKHPVLGLFMLLEKARCETPDAGNPG